MQVEDRVLAVAGSLLLGLGLLLGPGLVAGCGGDSDAGGGDVSTGVARDKQLAELSTSEAGQACDRLQAGLDRAVTRDTRVRTFCTLYGAAATETASECNTLRDGCIRQAANPDSQAAMAVDMIDVDFNCGEDAVLSECSATVGQLETCFNETLHSIEAALRDISCDDAPSIELDDIDGITDTFVQPAASCEAIDCPNSPFGF